MKKSELRSGMSIELANGDIGLLIHTEKFGIVVQYDRCWGDLESYDENLQVREGSSQFRIIKVRTPSYECHIVRDNLLLADVIYKGGSSIEEKRIGELKNVILKAKEEIRILEGLI